MDTVLNIDPRGLWFGTLLRVVKLLMGPGCHGGHDELHRGFWAVFQGGILAVFRRNRKATIVFVLLLIVLTIIVLTINFFSQCKSTINDERH
jgi:hypothetical protein